MSKIEKLTPAQVAKLSEYREKWLEYGLSTTPIDFEQAKQAVIKAYECAGLEPPTLFIRLRSPMEGAIGSALLKNIPDQVWDRVRARVGDRVGDQVWARVGDQVWDQVRARVGAQVWDQVGAQVWDQVRDQVRGQVGAQVWDQVRGQVRGQVWGQVWARVGDQVWDQVWDQVGDQVGDQVWDQVGDQVGDQVRGQVWDQVGEACYGQHDANWVGFYEYFNSELKIKGADKIAGLVLVTQTCGWWWAFKNAVIITNRPCELHRDEQGRLHNPTCAAILYPDGWGVYAIHGVRVPESVILRPDTITVKQIDDERNAEIRRVMIDQYNGNRPERYLLEAGAKEIHKDAWGRLLRRDIPNDEPILMVEVANSTPNPDGTRKLYYLRCEPNLRPMKRKADGTQVFGEPQKMTARNAIASTFFKRGEEYQPLIES